MFGKKAKPLRIHCDKDNQIPIVKCNICNGEQVAGFKDVHTGKF